MNNQIIIKVRGVLKDEGKILFCYNKKQDFYFLPGGTLENKENARKCLQREFQEECRLDVTVGKFLGCLEFHWQEDKNQYQELDLIFEVDSPNKAIPTNIQSVEPHISFKFLTLPALLAGKVKVLPALVLEFLHENSTPGYLFENQIFN